MSSPSLSTTTLFSVQTTYYTSPETFYGYTTYSYGSVVSRPENITVHNLTTASAVSSIVTLLIPSGTGPTLVLSETVASLSGGGHVVYTLTGPADFLSSSSTNSGPTATITPPATTTPLSISIASAWRRRLHRHPRRRRHTDKASVAVPLLES